MVEKIRVSIIFESYIPEKEYYENAKSIDEMAQVDLEGDPYILLDGEYKMIAEIVDEQGNVLRRVN